MQPSLALDRNRQIKRIHQEALAAPDASQHIDAARHLGVHEEFFQSCGTLPLELDPIVEVTLQSLDSQALGFVSGKAPFAQGLLIVLLDIHPRSIKSSQPACRSEEHTSELQSLMRISYAVFCLKKKTKKSDETI